MNNKVKAIFVIVIALFGIAFTYYNYSQGKTSLEMFCFAVIFLGLIIANIIRLLIRDGK